MLMATHLGFGKVKDEPAATDIREGEPELVPKEGAEFFHLDV